MEGWQTFSVKAHKVNILGFVGKEVKSRILSRYQNNKTENKFPKIFINELRSHNITESLSCIPETNITLLIDCTPI